MVTPILLNGMSIIQKGHKFYIVKVKAIDIDRLCKVPTIPFDRENREIATWVFSQTADKWQRELDETRVHKIADFFTLSGNFLVNSTVIAIPFNADWLNEVQDHVNISIPITWLVHQCPSCGYSPSNEHSGEKFDACPNCEWDGRPGTIIDGQHRIRGAARAYQYNSEEIVAIVLTENVFSTADMAKIFTEITTYAVDLHELHKIYLLYKFKLKGGRIGPLTEADFSIDPPTPPAKNTKGLRNRRAYEIVCTLCSLTNSRWYDRITILPEATGRQRRGDIIEAHDFVSLIEQWLEDGVLKDPSQSDGMIDIDTVVLWLQTYLEAILSIWPIGSGTPQGTSNEFWHLDRQPVGILQQRGIIEVLLKLFPIVTKRILDIGVRPDLTNYKANFAYIENIDWLDPKWKGLSNPDKNKEMLLKILQHLFIIAPNPVGDVRVEPWINTWIKAPPDPVRFIQVPSGILPIRNASNSIPLIFKWESTSQFTGTAIESPINAYAYADVYLIQIQGGQAVVLKHIETSKNYIELKEPPPGLDTKSRASPITIQVEYTNHNESRMVQTQHPA